MNNRLGHRCGLLRRRTPIMIIGCSRPPLQPAMRRHRNDEAAKGKRHPLSLVSGAAAVQSLAAAFASSAVVIIISSSLPPPQCGGGGMMIVIRQQRR